MKLLVRLLIGTMLACFLSACVIAPIPIDNLTYQGASTVKTDKTASVIIKSSGVGGTKNTFLMPAGGIFIPMAQNSNSEAFNLKDRQEFLQSLKKELVRLGVVKSVTSNEGEVADMVILVNIDRAFFNFDRVEYTLDITLSLNGGKSAFQRQYQVVSFEGDSFGVRNNTNGAEARLKLAQKMLEKLMPDIEAYALAMTHT